jgi:arabinogalactan endo-1,4-beta-galactosidase
LLDAASQERMNLSLVATAMSVLASQPAEARSSTPFLAGVDFSLVGLYETRGLAYRDAGAQQDPFRILKDHGVNCIRLRLFTSSAEQAEKSPYNYGNNLAYTVPIAARVKKAGLKFMLDFHYSDTWADPAHQAKPSAWEGLDFNQLEQKMYAYNRDCMAAFERAHAVPDYVQVGNEITPGMVWPDGRVGGPNDTPEQWNKLGRLMKAAIRGIRAGAGRRMPKIVIHLDRGGDWAATRWFFDHIKAQDVPFDIIGESYYPFWHGTLDDLRTCLDNAAARYQKPVIVAETDFPWVDRDGDGDLASPILGIKPGKDGQVEYIHALAAVVRAVPGNRGVGIFWWGTEYLPLPGVNLAGFDSRSFFDHDGNALPGLDAFGALSKPVAGRSSQK